MEGTHPHIGAAVFLLANKFRKVTKAVDIKLVASPPGSALPYKLEIKDKHVLSEDEKKTQEYDKLAFRYVSYVTIPILLGYSIYSLLYNSHRGWYSFTISTLTSFVYMFGFVSYSLLVIVEVGSHGVRYNSFRSSSLTTS